MSTNQKNERYIVYVEDDEDDRMLFSEAMNEAFPQVQCHTFSNGPEALSFLSAASSTGQLPHHIVLDINMPIMHGYEVAAEIRKHEALKDIPLTYFSTSPRPSYLMLGSGNTFYRQKPTEFGSYKTLMQEMLGSNL